MNRFYVIYKLTSPSGKVYIGQTSDLNKRFSTYRNLNIKRQPKLIHSIKKYGWESFKVELLYNGVCSKEEIDFLEEKYIKEYYGINCLNDSLLANGFTWKSGKENTTSKPVFQYNTKGEFIHSWESGRSITTTCSLDGGYISYRCLTKEHFAYNYFWFYKEENNIEYIQNYITLYKAKPPKNSRRIVQLDYYGNYIRTWESISEASRNLGVSGSCLSNIVNGKKSTLKSFRWAKEIDYLNNTMQLLEIRRSYKPILCTNVVDETVTEFKSIKEASENLGIARSTIIRNLKNKIKKSKKYDFKYKTSI
jgi:group I intron endonuclease